MNTSIALAFSPAQASSAEEERKALLREIGVDTDSVAVIQREQAALDARAVALLAAAARKANRLATLAGGSLEHSRRSLVAEVATTLLLPESTAAQRIDEAEIISESLPATLAALARGDISYRHAQAIVRQAKSLPPSAHGEFEVVVLAKATAQTSTQLSTHARTLRERLHPESIDVRHREAREGRAVWVETEHDGMATMVCHLPAVSAFAIDDTLDQLARSRGTAEETRTHAQLRADGLVALLLHRDGEISRQAQGITANIAVTVPVMTLLGHADDPAELRGYGPIDLETARRLAAGAPSLLRILTDPVTEERLSVGRERYKVPTDLRTAVVLDDETCRFPGCVRPADRCDLDHTRDWAKGGETGLTNLAALCRRHHTLKHQEGWRVAPGRGRALHWTSPSGAVHTTRPPDHTTKRSKPVPPQPTSSRPAEPADPGDAPF